jgi:hypothetical protein
MTLPGFNADASLYKTGIHYLSMGALVQGGVQDGRVVPQQVPPCGPCYLDKTGACVKSCWLTICFPPFGDPNCFTSEWTEPCPKSACPTPVDCLLMERDCTDRQHGTVFYCRNDLTGCPPYGTGCACCPPCCFICV